MGTTQDILLYVDQNSIIFQEFLLRIEIDKSIIILWYILYDCKHLLSEMAKNQEFETVYQAKIIWNYLNCNSGWF